VAERRSEAPGRDDVPREGIGLPSRHSRPQVLDGATLSGLNQRVDRPLPLVGPGADYNHTGKVGTVSVHLRAEVKQQQLAKGQYPVACARMGQSGTGPRSNDGGKGVPLTSPPAKGALQRCTHLDLGLPRPNAGQHCRKRLLSQAGCGLYGRHFLRRLHGPETFHQLRRGGHSSSRKAADALRVSYGE
jgi:hypothetical protein